MDIAVCMKQVPLSASEGMDSTTHTVIREGVGLIVNPADEHALEAAFTLASQTSGTVSAISMGRLTARDMLKDMGRLGVDRLVLVNDPAFAGSDTYVTAKILCRAITRHVRYDLIICGRRALDGETGQTGPELATMAGIPCITNVTSIEVVDVGTVRCVRLLEEYRETVTVRLPALVTVCEGMNTLRKPSIATLRKARSVQVEILDNSQLMFEPGEVGLKGSPTTVESVKNLSKTTRTCRFLPTGSESTKILGAVLVHTDSKDGADD